VQRQQREEAVNVALRCCIDGHVAKRGAATVLAVEPLTTVAGVLDYWAQAVAVKLQAEIKKIRRHYIAIG